ncbi:C-type lectin domain family 5 member A isoform X2 [Pogona vitticeps]
MSQHHQRHTALCRDRLAAMGWQHVVPGVTLLLVKIMGTSLFFVFIPHIFPRGNISFAYEENRTELQTTQSLPEATTTFPAASTIKAKIPPKAPRWEGYEGSDYWFSEDMASWLNSRTTCKIWNSELVIINDRKELEFISNKTRMADYFIGLTYMEPEEQQPARWQWNDGRELERSLADGCTISNTWQSLLLGFLWDHM